MKSVEAEPISTPIGYELFGSGPMRVVIMNDWLCDTSTWDGPAAAAGYVAMFARDGLPDPSTPIAIPVLAITGERDAEPMRRDGVTRNLEPLCAQLEVTPLADSGHYPMQGMPPLTVALVERFLGG